VVDENAPYSATPDKLRAAWDETLCLTEIPALLD
jgi:hypothetical protein